MGKINVEFDRRVLDLVGRNDIDSLAQMTDSHIIDEAGNGALEVRNWIVAMSAVPRLRSQVMAYEPVDAWVTGLGFAELTVGAAT